MLLLQAVTAYLAVTQMIQSEWEYDLAYALVLLKKELQPHVDFYGAEELKLAEEFGKKDENGKVIYQNGASFECVDAQAGREYNKKRNELGALEIEFAWKCRKVKAPKTIKATYLEALYGLIEFEMQEG